MKRSHKTIVAVGLIAAGLAAIGIGLSVRTTPTAVVPLASRPAPATPTATTPATRGGKHGGGGSAAPALPADWPAGIPAPAGSLVASAGSVNLWSASYLVAGDYPTAMKNLRRIFTSAGFTDLSPKAALPFEFENANYRIQVGGSNHDHSAASTDVVIHVIRK